MRNNRFQNRITAGRFTLPAAILISVGCWMAGISLQLDVPVWSERIPSFVLYGIIGYFLITLNNTFAIIRTRASMQSATYFLLVSVCPHIHTLYTGNLVALLFLATLFFLFKSYQRTIPTGTLFNAFICLGTGSLLFPPLMLFIPVFWIGAHSFQALHVKSFFASWMGLGLPYWLLLSYAYLSGHMELFYRPFEELATFYPLRFDLQLWEIATIGYLLILYMASSGHCIATGYEDKIRTRSYLQFLIFLTFCLFVYIGLQPTSFALLLPSLLITISILSGHLFVLSNSRSSNILFIVMLVGLFCLFGFNLWTL